MSLILLHRLKFSPIKDDFVLFKLFILFYLLSSSCATDNQSTSNEKRNHDIKADDEYNKSSQRMFESIRLAYHGDENLHSKNIAVERILFKRDVSGGGTSGEGYGTALTGGSNDNGNDNNDDVEDDGGDDTDKILNNSTKILNYSNKSIEIINFSEITGSVAAALFSDIKILNFSQNLIINVSSDSLILFSHSLEKLDLSENLIELFNISHFDKLHFLNLSNNRIHRFDSLMIKSLRVLDLTENLFENSNEINLTSLNNLKRLDMSCNKITKLNHKIFQNTTKLKILNLSCNRIVKIYKDDFLNLINLKTLLLTNNNISEIENNTFTYLPNLQYLDLSWNNIDSTSIRALQGIPDLVALSVAFNYRLGSALQGFVASWSLKELDASGTGLCQVPAALAQSVHILNISFNHFKTIRCGDLDSYPLLQKLDLSFNNIVDIEEDALGRLEILDQLYLANNYLTTIPQSLPSSLTSLYLQSNKISDIVPTVFLQLINLEILDLSSNQLTYLPGLPLPRLITLNLRASGLRGLSQSLVKKSPNLKDLLLEKNPIKCNDLMGIAEWVTACRNEKPTYFNNNNNNNNNNKVKINKDINYDDDNHIDGDLLDDYENDGDIKSFLQLLRQQNRCTLKLNQQEKEMYATKKNGEHKSICTSENIVNSDLSKSLLLLVTPNYHNKQQKSEDIIYEKYDKKSILNNQNNQSQFSNHDNRNIYKNNNNSNSFLNKSINIGNTMNETKNVKIEYLKNNNIFKTITTPQLPKVVKKHPMEILKNITKITNINKNKLIKLKTENNLHKNISFTIENEQKRKEYLSKILLINKNDQQKAKSKLNNTSNIRSSSQTDEKIKYKNQRIEKLKYNDDESTTLTTSDDEMYLSDEESRQPVSSLPIVETTTTKISVDVVQLKQKTKTNKTQIYLRKSKKLNSNVAGENSGNVNGVTINKKNRTGNDKLDHLTDSLTQMMTNQKDTHLFTQTGLTRNINKNLNDNDNKVVAMIIVPVSNILNSNTTNTKTATTTTILPNLLVDLPYVNKHQHQQRQQQQQQQQLLQHQQYKHNNEVDDDNDDGKKIINSNTNNPISLQDNKSTNIKYQRIFVDDTNVNIHNDMTFSASNNDYIISETDKPNMKLLSKEKKQLSTVSIKDSSIESSSALIQQNISDISEESSSSSSSISGGGDGGGASDGDVTSKSRINHNQKHAMGNNNENTTDCGDKIDSNKKITKCKDENVGKIENSAIDVVKNNINKNAGDNAPKENVMMKINIEIKNADKNSNGILNVLSSNTNEPSMVLLRNMDQIYLNDKQQSKLTTPANNYTYDKPNEADKIKNLADKIKNLNNTTINLKSKILDEINSSHENNNNDTTNSGLSEEWNDIRITSGHPGLFIVISITISMFILLAFIHFYRYRRPFQRNNSNFNDPNDSIEEDASISITNQISCEHFQDQYTPTHHHRDLLPMELIAAVGHKNKINNPTTLSINCQTENNRTDAW